MQNVVPLELDTCLSLCSTLEALLLDSVGPNGLYTMITTSDNSTLISGDGYTIVTSLMLSHPVARLVVDHMKSHHGKTGDNAKSFILQLTEILRHVSLKEGGSVTCGKRQQLTELSHGLAELHSVLEDKLLPELLKFCVFTTVSEQSRESVEELCFKIIRTNLAGKFNPRSSKHVSEVLCKFILESCSELSQLDKTVLYLLDHFEEMVIEVTNESVLSSRIINGVIWTRDFAYKSSNLVSFPQIKFMILNTSFENITPNSASSLQISSTNQLLQALNFKTIYTQTFIEQVKAQGVNLIVSAEALSEAALYICRKQDISVIHMVPAEQIAHIAHIAQIRTFNDPDDVIDESTIGIAEFCHSVLIGNSKYVNLGISTKQLILCSPTKGLCRQWYTAVHNAMKCILMWLNHEQIIDLQKLAKSYEHGTDLHESHSTRLDQKGDQCAADDSCSKDKTGSRPPSEMMHIRDEMLDTNSQHLCGISIQGGGAVEFLISKILSDISLSTSTSPAMSKACKLVAVSILCLPRSLYANSFISKTAKNNFIHVQNQIESELSTHGRLKGIDGKSGRVCNLVELDVVEPILAKYLLICDVVKTAQELLRIDAVIGVKGSLKDIRGEETDKTVA
ncbi:BBSome complex assembly protein BBS10-like [Amphiura filiformis]|uniref:BBSome complex assembly protein BBS10-like n=1 Tax=Amphiura filiformis TaxID=82378 RepID=UPI003B20DF0E